MANPVKGEVAFVVGGKSYTLCYDHKSLIEMEDKLDRGFFAIAQELSDASKVRIKTMVTFFWAGLRKHHPDIDIEQAGELMQSFNGGIFEGFQLLNEAFTRTFNDPESKGERPQTPKAGNGVGTNASSSTSPSASPSNLSGT